jgi:hypothetical protein
VARAVTLAGNDRRVAPREELAMYLAIRTRSIWRLVLATATTSFLVAVVVLGSSSHGASSWQAPVCGARPAPSAQAISR